MAPSPLLLLFFLVVPAFSATLFVISGIITCNASPFMYQMRVIEDDQPAPKNDILFTDAIRSSKTSPVFYNITTSETTDHVTNYYELAFEIVHNCHANALTYNFRSRFEIGDYPITHGTHVISLNMDLTNHGKAYQHKIGEWVDEDLKVNTF